MADVGEITGLLKQLGDDDSDLSRQQVLERLIPLVYVELKQLARSHRYRWGPSSPGTTSIVHEAYARLARRSDASYENRREFFALASKAMRSVLIDNARWHQRQKRGGKDAELPLQEDLLVSADRSQELIALDEALSQLDGSDPGLARVVECRCFGGLTTAETAEALEVSPATVKRRWSLARAWLYQRLRTQLT